MSDDADAQFAEILEVSDPYRKLNEAISDMKDGTAGYVDKAKTAESWEKYSGGDNFINIAGRKMCWGQMTIQYSATSAASGSSYYGDSTRISGGTFAQSFTSPPTINLTIRQGTTSMLEVEAVDVSTFGINKVRIHRANAYTDTEGVLVDYIAIGI
jgi:hypothetical protein